MDRMTLLVGAPSIVVVCNQVLPNLLGHVKSGVDISSENSFVLRVVSRDAFLVKYVPGRMSESRIPKGVEATDWAPCRFSTPYSGTYCTEISTKPEITGVDKRVQ
jgi:hypothetical protein